jgi:glycosyltransferase 2 family protein
MSSLESSPLTDPGSKSKKLNWVLPAKIILTVVILFLIFKNNDWAKFGAEFKNAQLQWILLGFISMGLGLALGALRWNQLLRVQEVFITNRKTMAYTLIGTFFSQFLPASTGGDFIKIFYILKDAPDRKARAALSTILDRVLGLTTILMLTLLLAPFEYQRITEHAETRIFILILTILVTGILGGLLLLWFIPTSLLPPFCHRIWNKLPKRDVLASLYEGFHAHRESPRLALTAVILAILAAAPVLSTGYFIAKSLQLDVTYPQMIIIFSIVICSMSLPISFGGHGLREGAFILLFHVFNITRSGIPVELETATACSTIFLGISVIWSLFGGLTYLFYSHNLKKIP